MLQNIRDNASGTLAKVIVGLIALTFVVTGVQFVSFSGEPEVAVVNDQPISERDFLRELDNQRRQLLSLVQDPALIDESLLRSRVLDSLIQQTAVLTESADRGISFGDAQIDVLLTTAPEFQQDGQFSPVLFDQFVARQGLGRVEFREQLKEQLAVNQWTQGIADSAFVVSSQVEQALQLEGQTRVVQVQSVVAAEQALTASPSDSDLQALYDANPARWQQPARVAVDYLLLERNRGLADVEVDEAEVREAYDRYVASLAASQELRASHILVPTLEEAESALARIQSGETFEAVAGELSIDTLSGNEGGDLGFASSDTYEPEFARALEALAVDQISEPVETRFGFHLIKLTESRDQEPESFESQAAQLRESIAENVARIEYQADAEELANISFAGPLEEAAEVLGLEIQSTDWFTENQGSGIAENLGVRVAAFGNDVQAGENSTLLEIDEGVLVIRLRDSEPARQLSVQEVRDELVVAWESSEQARLAAAAAQDLIAGLSSSDQVSLTRTGDELPTSVIQQVYAMAPGDAQVLADSNGDAYAVKFISAEAGDLDDTVGMQAFLASQARQQAGRALGEWASAQAEVER